MKKILLVLLAAGAVLTIGLFGYLAINGDSLISKYKPELEKIASENIGAKVTLGQLSVSVFPGVKVKVADFSISGSSTKDNIGFKDLYLNLSPLGLLFGELKIAKLEIHEPAIRLLKTGSKIRIAGLPEKSEDPGPKAKVGDVSKVGNQSDPVSATTPLQIGLDSLEVINANVILLDTATNKEYNLAKVNLSTSIAIKDSVISVSNISLNGDLLSTGKIKMSGSITDLKESDGNLDLNGKLTNLVSNEISPLLDLFSGSTSAGSKDSVNAKTDLSFKLTGTVSAPLLTSTIDLNLEDAPISAVIDAQKVGDLLTISKGDIEAFSGKVLADAQINSKTENLAANLELTSLNLQQLVNTLMPTKRDMFSGSLDKLSLSINGVMGEQLTNSLNGRGKIILKDGKMVGTNLAGDVLGAIGNLPFLNGSLLSNTSEGDKNNLSSKETEIKNFSANFLINDARITTQDLILESNIFTLNAHGSVGFDSSVDLKCRMTFNPEFSQGIVAKVKELKQSLDQEGRLIIPLALKGKAPIFIVTPDVSELVKKGLKDVATKALGDLFNKDKTGNKKGLGGLLGF